MDFERGVRTRICVSLTHSFTHSHASQQQQNTGALGCGYSGKTVDVRRHETERCRRRMVVCPHEGCEVWVPFEDIPAHSMVCQAVRLPCKNSHI